MAKSLRSIFPKVHEIGSPVLGSPSLEVYRHDMGKKEREVGQGIQGRKGTGPLLTKQLWALLA